MLNASGAIQVQLGNHNGGANGLFIETMNCLLNQTYQQAQTLSSLTNTPMGVIAERLPTISLQQGEMLLSYKDLQAEKATTPKKISTGSRKGCRRYLFLF